jgi:cellulose synthase operon protein C
MRILQVLTVFGLVAIGGPLSSAQAPSPFDAARIALNAGQFEEVERLLEGETATAAAALRARAAVAQGRYAEAEQILAPAAAAQPGSDAALELGLLQQRLGRRADATRTLERLFDTVTPRTGAEYLRVGRALHALGDARNANTAFQRAVKASPEDPAVHTGWGELWLHTHNPAEAAQSFQDALAADETWVPARVGLARVALSGNVPAARAQLEQALKINPRSVQAHLLTAELALDNRQRDDARDAIDRALAINPVSLEARSLSAAIAFVEDRVDDFEREAEAVLAVNPRYGEVFRVAGDHAARNYRFDDAAALARRALEADPDSTAAWADLGLHLMRTGDEPGARRALDRAWEDDPFNYITHNLLELLDKLDDFVTVEEGDIVFKFHPDEVGVMREYALPLAQEALSTLAAWYEVSIDEPILIEMFPVHDDFAVRNVGLPGMVGALGACFGRVVTLDSPRARPPGDFNWKATLWHEIAHVVTLHLSNNRVPRWLTEGISVWEERRARPEWGREMEVSFASALNEGRVLKLDVLNEGFSDPRMISLAYYQSSLVVDHIVDTYGEAALRDLLRAYGRGLEGDAALQQGLGVDVGTLQASFDARLEREYAGLRRALDRPKTAGAPSLEELRAMAGSHPESFPVHLELGRALHRDGEHAAAIAALERAAELVPAATGSSNPHLHIAAIAEEMGDTGRAIRALEAVMRVDHADVASARRLVALIDRTGDPARIEDAYRRLVAIDPFDPAAQRGLGRFALQRKDAQTAVRAFRAHLATNPADRATAHADLAEAYITAGQLAEARRETLSALEIAPSFERAQDLLLQIVDAGV